MSIWSRIFGGATPEDKIDKDIKQACDSDEFENIANVINGHKAKLDMAIKYLSDKDNLSMKLRVMALPIADSRALMVTLMALESYESSKINRLCKDGFNPVLHFSACKGKEILIRVLAHAGANLDIVGKGGQTPLAIASENGLAETVKMLINNGAKTYDKRDASGFGPLHYACQLGNADMVETLLKAGADVNVMSADKLMPIHLAISTAQAARLSPTSPNGIPWSVQGAANCIQLLINRGADLNYVCPYGFSGMSFLKMIGAIK